MVNLVLCQLSNFPDLGQNVRKIQSIYAKIVNCSDRVDLIILPPRFFSFLYPNVLYDQYYILKIIQQLVSDIPIIINPFGQDFFLVSANKISKLTKVSRSKHFLPLDDIIGMPIDLYMKPAYLALNQKPASVLLSQNKRAFIYLNKVGIEDKYLFLGDSFIAASQNQLLLNLPGFTEYVGILSINSSNLSKDSIYTLKPLDNFCSFVNHCVPDRPDFPDFNPELVYQSLLVSIYDYFQKYNLNHAVLGLSGGIDSSLMVALLADIFPAKQIHAFYLSSCYNSELSRVCVQNLVNNLGIKFFEKKIDNLVEEVHQFFNQDSQDFTRFTCENIYARVRALLLMTYSNHIPGSIVLSTINKSELSVGYVTINGDTCGGFAPFYDLYKTQIYQLAYWRNKNIPALSCLPKLDIIPEIILKRKPTSELSKDILDEIDLPPYEVIDNILMHLFHGMPLSLDVQNQESYYQVLNMVLKNRFKRSQLPFGPKFYF